MVEEAYRIYFVDNSINRIVGKKYIVYATVICVAMAIIINSIFDNIIIIYNLSEGIPKFIQGILLLSLWLLILNCIFKDALKKSGYSTQSFIVDFSRIDKYRKQQLKNYLDIRLNKENRRDVLERFYVLLDEEIDRQKAPALINWAIVAAIIGPLWLHFVESIFQKYIHTFSDAVTVFIAITVLILILIYIFSVLVEHFKEYMNGRYIKLKKLKSLIKEIEFEWLNEGKLAC